METNATDSKAIPTDLQEQPDPALRTPLLPGRPAMAGDRPLWERQGREDRIGARFNAQGRYKLGRKPKLTESQEKDLLEKIVPMRKNGMGYKEIGKAVGQDHQFVMSRLRAVGLGQIRGRITKGMDVVPKETTEPPKKEAKQNETQRWNCRIETKALPVCTTGCYAWIGCAAYQGNNQRRPIWKGGIIQDIYAGSCRCGNCCGQDGNDNAYNRRDRGSHDRNGENHGEDTNGNSQIGRSIQEHGQTAGAAIGVESQGGGEESLTIGTIEID